MSEAGPLLLEVDGRVATLTLARPERGNALSPELLVALEEGWARVEGDADIRVAIITGVGERHFCTGADVGSLKPGLGGLRDEPYAQANRFSPRMCRVTKPVICAVNGLTNGGGLHFIADCDIVVASATAEFLDSHVNVGAVSALESQGIARRAGLGAALLLALTGKAHRMSAERAYQLGMVDLLEPSPDAARARALSLARAIAENSPRAVALTKQAIWATTELPDPTALEFGWELLKSHWSHPDFAEGPKAFVDKRTPQWQVGAEDTST